jgi:CubicO group peptidase (beta-lactamase class C family)
VKELVDRTDQVAAESKFSGAVRVDNADGIVFAKAYGLANRAYALSNTVETRFGIASGTKGLTALTIVALIERKSLNAETKARSLLGDGLPMVDDDVTVEHLLCHQSGIGDYLDEDTDIDVTDYIMPIPIHELNSTESYLRVLGGHATKFAPGQQFSYCNSGYVLLALLAERATATPFHDLVVEHVCRPAGMTDTTFLRSDELPGTAAVGYLTAEDNRSNVFHLPVLGSGDGGIYSTAADMRALWTALYAGQIVSSDWVAKMMTPRSDVPENSSRYGMGFWLHKSTDSAILEGSDAGVSFRSVHDPRRGLTYTVLSNTSQGAWPLAKHLDEALAP